MQNLHLFDREPFDIQNHEEKLTQAKIYQEWVIGSGVDPAIVELNVKALQGVMVYEYLTSENSKRLNTGRLAAYLLKRYELAANDGGWWVAGVDPITGERMQWGQFKPNSPRVDIKKNKPIKYEAPDGIPTRVFFLEVPRHIWELISTKYNCPIDSSEHFWGWVIKNNLPITVVEGAKKAGALLTIGVIAVAVSGVYNATRKTEKLGDIRQLAPDLKHFATPGRKVFSCFDTDKKAKTRAYVAKASKVMLEAFDKAGCEAKFISLPGDGGKVGADDFIVTHGALKFHELYKSARNWSIFKKKQPWGFGKQEQVTQNAAYSAYSTGTQPLTTPIHVYKKDDTQSVCASAYRLSTWIESPFQYIFDSSGTGSGKSYDAGRLQPSDFGASQIFYVSNDSRNPTTPTLQKDWAHLEGRHNGLIRDNKDKIRRKKGKVNDGEQFVADKNCGRVDTINALKNANIQGAYSVSVACQNCAYLEACKSGHVFGYLNARAKTFDNSRIISHPQSLPSLRFDFDYSDSVIIWEEWGEIFKNSEAVQVSARDIDMLITQLATTNSELLISLLPLLTKIKAILTKGEKAPTRYGWSYEHLKELLKIPENIDLAALEEATAPDLTALNPTKEHGVDIADLPPGVRKKFQERDGKTSELVKQTVLKQWILPLISVLSGEEIGYISADFNNLTITTPNNRLAEIAASAKKNIFLDATGRTIELAQLLNIPHTQIFKCKQEEEEKQNLEVVQVAGLGRMGINRGDDQQKRGKAVISELIKQCKEKEDKEEKCSDKEEKEEKCSDKEEKGEKCEVISFKNMKGKYQWFVDSRGSNDLEGIENIILDGIPTANLEALKAEFTCIHGRAPETGTKTIKQKIELNNPLPSGVQPHFEYEVSIDDEFAEFIRHRILQTINQAIGRNRSERYPDKQFKVYILGDYPLDIPVTLVEAKEITPEAATKLERLQMAMKKAVEQLKSEGRKITQKAVAELANVSQQRISQLREFLLVLLKGDLYTKTSKNNSPPKPPPDAEWAAQTYLPLIASEPNETILESISVLFDGYSLPELVKIWQMTDGKTQIDLLSVLFGCVPGICQVSQ